MQIEVANAELYAFDDEPIIKAKEMGCPDLVSMKPRNDYFIFKVESTGALYAYNIVLLGFDVLLAKLGTLKYSGQA